MNQQPVSQGCMVADKNVTGAGFFCDYVVKVILNDPAFGPTTTARQQLLYKGGLTITTTLVPAEQAQAVKSIQDNLPTTDPSGIGAAMSVVEPGTGKITAMAQNREYYPVANPGPTQTSVNWNTSHDYGASNGFPAGSTFKIFTLIEWLKTGHSLNQTFDGTLHPFNQHDFTACGKPYPVNAVWKPTNSEGNGGVMNAIEATKNSVNSAYLAMAEQLDLCNIMQNAADLGVVQPAGKAMGQNIPAVPSNVIGSSEVTPLAMAAAVAALADNGTYCAPIAITRVVDTDGKDLPVPSAGCQQKLEPRIAAAVNYTLKNVWQGTAKGLGQPKYPAAGKTGTTSEAEDIWFVGYTPLRAAAAWVGHPDSFKSMNGMTINGHQYNRRTGGPFGANIPGPIWREFMDQFMSTQGAVPDFSPPGNNEVYGVMTPVPDVVGLSQGDATAALQAAGFTVKISGTQATDPSPAGTVVRQSATGTAPRNSVITLTLSNGQGQQPTPTDQPTNNGPGNNNTNTPPGQGTGQGGHGGGQGGG
jgi:membrane peptidoglycan carboxypeptidase